MPIRIEIDIEDHQVQSPAIKVFVDGQPIDLSELLFSLHTNHNDHVVSFAMTQTESIKSVIRIANLQDNYPGALFRMTPP